MNLREPLLRVGEATQTRALRRELLHRSAISPELRRIRPLLFQIRGFAKGRGLRTAARFMPAGG